MNIAAYKDFLRAGGRITFEWWSNQSDEAKGMLAKAGREIAAEDACAAATAASGPEGYASVYAEVDDGALHMRVVMEEAVNEVMNADKASGVRL